MNYVHWLSRSLVFPDLGAKILNNLLNGRLEASNRSLGEEGIERITAKAVRFVGNGSKGHVIASEHARGPLGLLDIFRNARVELSNKRVIIDMQLIRVDAYYVA